MPWMLALDPTSETAAELVSLGFTPVTMYMKHVLPYHSEGHIKLSDEQLSRMKFRPRQYASFSFIARGELGAVYAAALTDDTETKVLLLADGFEAREVYLKDGPKGSILYAIPEGDRQFRSMRHVPSRFVTTCYWRE